MTLKTKVQSVRRYEATDGKEFEDRAEAKKYQARLDLADLLDDAGKALDVEGSGGNPCLVLAGELVARQGQVVKLLRAAGAE